MRAHKVLTGVAAFVVLVSCTAALGDDPAAEDTTSTIAEDDETSGDRASIPPVVTTQEPVGPEEQWRSHFHDNEAKFTRALSRRVPGYRLPKEALASVVVACQAIVEEQRLVDRLRDTAGGWQVDEAQALVILDMVTTYVCPDAAPGHAAQVAAKGEADRVAAAKARKRAAREARRAKAAAERERQRELAASMDPLFGTCGEANDNGYGNYRRGADPEYGNYDDRDGDGVVCEF